MQYAAIVCITIAIASASVGALHINTATIKREFYDQFDLHFNNATSDIQLVLARINDPAVVLDDLPFANEPSTCLKCRVFVHTLLEYVDRNARTELDQYLERLLRRLCNQLTPLSPAECQGYASNYRQTIGYILKHQPSSRHANYSEGVCAVLYQPANCGASGYTIPMNLSTGVTTTLRHAPKQYTRNADLKNLTILHLTDFHYDPLYATGSPAQCGESICCRNSSTAQAAATAAGHWGDYAVCDTPGWLVENVCAHIARQHPRIDYIYYTGDFIDHFEWLTSKQWVRDSVAFVTDTMRRAFPGVPIVPLLGNHDVHPSNAFAPPSIDDAELQMAWLNDFVADQWAEWLPDSAVQTLRTHGYFTVLLRPSLRVVQVNSNVCYVKNVWLLFETDSLRDQLAWLHRTLAAAELAGEYVHLVGHVPANDVSCLAAWNDEYMRIVKRFAPIISGQFYGHTHQDEFAIMFAEGWPSSAPLSVAWTGGSVTSFVGLNSNYRLYYVDSDNFNVLDHDTWIFNLTEANAAGAAQQPHWFKEYSFLAEYNLTSLSPAVLGNVANTQWTDAAALRKLWENKIKRSDKMLADGCNDACQYGVWCGIVMCP